MLYDAIIVGSGPAGSAAAKGLAGRGRRVLVLERSRHPRRKVCGGCLSSRIDRLIGPGFHAVADRSVREVIFSYKSERFFYHKSQSPFAYLVRRERFDAHLAREASRAGARLLEGEPATDVEEGEDGVRVTTPRGRYEGRFLIGADGVSSLVARRLGLSGGRLLGIAREADIEMEPHRGVEAAGALTIRMGDVPFGYGWVFPKGSSVSAGVAGARHRVGDIKEAFRRFIARQGRLAEIGEISPVGYYLASVAGRRTPILTAKTLLVGDAAGFADPLLGEGVYYSVLSGQAAAGVVAEALAEEGDLASYRRRLEEEIFGEFDAARLMSEIFYGFPRFGYHVLEKGDVLEGFCDVLRGASTYRAQVAKMKRIGPPEILRYLGVLKPAERGGALRTRESPLVRRIRGPVKSAFAQRAEDRLRGLLRTHVPGEAHVLHVGGEMSEKRYALLRETNPARLVHMGPAPKTGPARPGEAGDAGVSLVRGDMTRLPFPDNRFDAVVCTEGLERLRNPRAAVREFLRVIRPTGRVVYLFSALPSTGRGRFASYLIEHAADWPFLPSDDQPFHRCGTSRLMEFAGGMLKVAVLGKCCDVEEPLSSCARV